MILRIVTALAFFRAYTQPNTLVANASTGQANEVGNKEDCSFCPAYHGQWYHLKCTSENVQLMIGYCITIEEQSRFFATKCPYYQLVGHNVSKPGYIKLPNNISGHLHYNCKADCKAKGHQCHAMWPTSALLSAHMQCISY